MTTDRPASPGGSHTQKEELWDAIASVRGRVKLGSGNWFVPYYLDADGGSSTPTWHLEDISFSGPALAVAFRF